MEKSIIDPKFEYEACKFVDFAKLQDEDDTDVDSWFDNRRGDDEGIVIPEEINEAPLKATPKPERNSTSNKDTLLKKMGTEESIHDNDNEVATKHEIKRENVQNAIEIVENHHDITEKKPASLSRNEEDKCEPKIVLECQEMKSMRNSKNSDDVSCPIVQTENVQNQKEVNDEDDKVQHHDSQLKAIDNVTEESNIDVEKGKETMDNEKKQSETVTVKEIQLDDTKNSDTSSETSSTDQPRKPERASKRRNRSLNSTGLANAAKRKRQTRSSAGSERSRRSRSRSNIPELKPQEVTVPVTPQCLKRQKTNKPTMIKLKTTEELEMECIAKLRKQTKNHIKANENMMKKAFSCTSVKPVKTNCISLTQPQEFNFQTERRIKQNPEISNQSSDTVSEDVEKGFWNSLRQHPPSPTWKNRSVTIPKPFNLSNGGQKKRKHATMEKDAGVDSDSYVPVALQVYKFQTSTPPRFHTKAANDKNMPCANNPEHSNDNTVVTKTKSRIVPKTPNLSTKTRSRPVGSDVLSWQEQEEKEVEKMKNYTFKAKPFDRRIVECDGMYGIPVKYHEAIAPTKPEPFSFESDERQLKRKEKSSTEETTAVNFKAMPQPNFEKIFRPQLKHEHTEPKPFSFIEKDKERWQKKEEKIQDVYKEEEKLREFKAQPLPSDSPDPLPAVATRCGTNMMPFSLNTDNRGAKKAEKWIQKIKTELEESRTNATFKAKPCKVVHDAPFVPQKSKKPLTEVSEFTLNTNSRAERHEELEMNKKEREQIDEELRRERDAQREKEEQEALVKLRQQLVHKAQPIHKYKNVKIKPSDKPLTEAQSPVWSEMKRRRVENTR
ncbi:targeting protein for Xklp2-like isoform X2 [Xenia sp. Carnegie-2017]|uniref:targeting protein for Xklp2-like isoform X2 n=1 Tax=Xenia sp. Carnegie-2017 TaxID=2897299 RepID=UPI001F03837A|nr:targeting protein for Xklp2-like isoform X2 [Xenia sp. Carnegie-2017]